MKPIIYIISVLFSTALIFNSCYKDLDLDEYRKPPKVVLNCAISPDTIIMASVSRTWFFTEVKPNACLSNADVKLYINGEFKEQMKWTPKENQQQLYTKGMYESTITPKAGDIIKIVAASDYGTAQAEDIVPEEVTIEGVEITYQKSEYTVDIYTSEGHFQVPDYDVKYHITFQDNPDRKDYYLIRISGESRDISIGSLEYSSDPVFYKEGSYLEGIFGENKIYGQGGRTFTDETINGKKYTLRVREENVYGHSIYGGSLKRIISLYSISKPYYQYFTSIQSMEEGEFTKDLAEYGLTEPMRIFSNVSGGVGIVGASYRFDMDMNLEGKIPELKVE